MDSINRQQPEHHRDDLRGGEAVKRIRSMIEDSPNCFFCTGASNGATDGTHPMNVRQVDDHGCLWFLSASDSHKNAEIARDPSVRLYFQGRSIPISCSSKAVRRSRLTTRKSRSCGSR